MTIESLDRAYRASPFRPFALHLRDGRSVPVPHPEFLSFNPKGRTAVVMDERDGFEAVDLLLVVSLGFEGEPARVERRGDEPACVRPNP
jgi:hypothetical protein